MLRQPRDVVEGGTAYDRYAPRYDTLLVENRINAHLRHAMLDYQAQTFHEGSRLLEVGCGTGDEAIALARRGCHVVAVDPSREMIRIARAKVLSGNLGDFVDFYVGRARDLDGVLADQPPASFDGAYSSFALSYEERLEPVRDAVGRVLRPGGIFLVASMNRLTAAEWAGAMAAFHPSLAGRRLRSATAHKVGLVDTPVYCRTAAQVATAFRPDFELDRVTGLSVALPPPYANRPLSPWPGLLGALSRLDDAVREWPVLRLLGDHHVLWLRRSGRGSRT